MIIVKLWNPEYFSILWSGIDSFDWEKSYYSTSSIQWTEIWEPEEIITYETRPSRANIQPIIWSVWFAKMAKTLKILTIHEEFAEKAILSTWFALIYGNPEKINPEYLRYFFLSSNFNSQKDKLSTGTTQVAINQKGIEKIGIPIFDIETQRLIISEIEKQFSRLDEWLSSLLRTRENLKSYRASLLRSAIEWRLTIAWRSEHPDIESADILLDRIRVARWERWLSENPGKKYKESEKMKEWIENIELPKWWASINVWSVADARLWKMLDKAKNKGELFPYLANISVRWWSFDLGNLSEMRFEKDEFEKFGMKYWDLIICEWWEPWRSAIWRDQVPNMMIQKALHRVRFYEWVSTDYFSYFLKYSCLSKIIEKYFTGTTIKHFTWESLDRFLFPLPPLLEQNCIVEILEEKFSVIDSLELLVNANIRRVENLKQAILKKAFSGELVQE